MTHELIRAGLVAALLAVAAPAFAAEAGTALKADDIKAEPFQDAKKTGSLAVGDRVDILKKNGGWFQIKSARGSGWVRMLSIRRGEAKKAGGGAGDVLGLASGRAGTGKVVATTGIRGLSEEELKGARFDEAQVRRMESFAVNRADAQRFAAQGKLSARKVDNLPAAGSQ